MYINILLFSESDRPQEVTYTVLPQQLSITPGEHKPAPPSARGTGEPPNQTSLTFTGCGLNRDKLQQWLRTCAPQVRLTSSGIYVYCKVGKARWAHLSTCHHTKPLEEALMWWRVLRSAHLAVPNDAVCIFSYKYLLWNGKIKLSSAVKINQTSEAYRRECNKGWSHHTSCSESQQHECKKDWYLNLGLLRPYISPLTTL